MQLKDIFFLLCMYVFSCNVNSLFDMCVNKIHVKTECRNTHSCRKIKLPAARSSHVKAWTFMKKMQSSRWKSYSSHCTFLKLSNPNPLCLILFTADWLNHRPPGHQDKWDPAGIGGSDQDRQSDRQHQWPTRHHHWHTDSHQPGSVLNHFMVSIQRKVSAVVQ